MGTHWCIQADPHAHGKTRRGISWRDSFLDDDGEGAAALAEVFSDGSDAGDRTQLDGAHRRSLHGLERRRLLRGRAEPAPDRLHGAGRGDTGERKFTAQACVAFSQPGMGMGLAFMEMEPAERERLRAWLDELGCGQNHVLAPAESEGSSQETYRGVLMHVIHLLVRKRILSGAEGEELLRELLR